MIDTLYLLNYGDIMFEKIRKGLNNFAHNLLNITHSLFGTGLLVGGIVGCAFFAYPIFPVLFYGVITAIVGSLLFRAAHRVVDFISNMFNKDAAEVVATPIATAATTTATHVHAASSTNKMHAAFAKNPAPKATVNAQTQTPTGSNAQTQTQTESNIKQKGTAAANEDRAPSRAASFK